MFFYSRDVTFMLRKEADGVLSRAPSGISGLGVLLPGARDVGIGVLYGLPVRRHRIGNTSVRSVRAKPRIDILKAQDLAKCDRKFLPGLASSASAG